MSVLIKGMDEIPYDGAVLMVKRDDDGKTYIKYVGVMGYRMELVELPEKHGPLIDADAFFSGLTGDDFEFSFHVDGAFVDVSKMNKILKNQPVVVEAEGE